MHDTHVYVYEYISTHAYTHNAKQLLYVNTDVKHEYATDYHMCIHIYTYLHIAFSIKCEHLKN